MNRRFNERGHLRNRTWSPPGTNNACSRRLPARRRFADGEQIGEAGIHADDLDLPGAGAAIGVYGGTGQQQRRGARLVGEQSRTQLLAEVAGGQHCVLDIPEALQSQRAELGDKLLAVAAEEVARFFRDFSRVPGP